MILNFKKEKPKKQYEDIQEWIPIEKIKDNSILLKNGNKVRILEIKPINFKLRSASQQNIILENYKRFFKRCNFDIQIIIQTQKADVTTHIENIKINMANEIYLKEMAEDYIELVKRISSARKSISRRFFIVIKEDDNIIENTIKVKEGLFACGNTVEEPSEEITKRIVKMYLNKRVINYL